MNIADIKVDDTLKGIASWGWTLWRVVKVNRATIKVAPIAGGAAITAYPDAFDHKVTVDFEAIARECLGIETLALRNRDHLDFHDCSVTGIKRALERAYAAGVADATSPVADA
jgi:hypothetical protein